MAFTGTNVIDAALRDLNDPSGVTWTRATLFGWIAEAMRTVVTLVPGAYQQRVDIVLTPSEYVQTLPATALRLIRVLRNKGAGGTLPGPRVAPASEDQLNRVAPNWTTSKPGPWIRNVCIDPQTPGFFYVYPRPAGALVLDAIVSQVPPATVAEATALPLQDIYQDAISAFLVFCAYSRNMAESNPQRAAIAYTRMQQSLGLKAANDERLDPTPRAKAAA